MKTAILSCAILSCVVSLAVAAPPAKKDDAKKKGGKTDNVSARDLITKNDTDGDKKLDKTELSSALKTLKRNVVSTKNDSWKKFDEDNDGKIDQKEMEKLLEASAPPPDEPVDPKAKPPAKEGGLTLRPPGTPGS
jgi:hypothetical protein